MGVDTSPSAISVRTIEIFVGACMRVLKIFVWVVLTNEGCPSGVVKNTMGKDEGIWFYMYSLAITSYSLKHDQPKRCYAND